MRGEFRKASLYRKGWWIKFEVIQIQYREERSPKTPKNTSQSSFSHLSDVVRALRSSKWLWRWNFFGSLEFLVVFYWIWRNGQVFIGENLRKIDKVLWTTYHWSSSTLDGLWKIIQTHRPFRPSGWPMMRLSKRWPRAS